MAAGPGVGATAACRRERRRGRRLVACPVRDAGGSPDEVVEARRLASRLARWRTGSDPCGQLVVLGSLPNGVTERRARRMRPRRDRLATVLSGRAARPSSRGCPAAVPRLRARGDSVERFGSLGMARRSDGGRGLPPPLVDRRPRARRRRANHAAIPRACCRRRRGRDEAQAPQRRPTIEARRRRGAAAEAPAGLAEGRRPGLAGRATGRVLRRAGSHADYQCRPTVRSRPAVTARTEAGDTPHRAASERALGRR